MATKTPTSLEAMERFTELADYVIPFTIRAICELGVADHLNDGPRSTTELAAATGSHEPSIYRALLALASKGIFTEVEPSRFALTPMAELLRSDHRLSMRDGYRLLPADIQAWARFDYSLRTGKAAFDLVHEQGYWEYLSTHSAYSRRFDRAMQTFTRLEGRAILGAYDWSGIESVVDIGGGNGELLTLLLRSVRTMRGTLFDQPHVVSGAQRVIDAAGVANRCEIVAGDAFDHIPAGADAYVIKRVLYDFDDDEAKVILRNVRAAMGPDSRLLLCDPVLQPGDSSDVPNTYGRIYDLLMLAMVSGHARSTDELAKLLPEAGLQLTAVVPTHVFPIVEARPI